jgi:hypothetical protein
MGIHRPRGIKLKAVISLLSSLHNSAKHLFIAIKKDLFIQQFPCCTNCFVAIPVGVWILGATLGRDAIRVWDVDTLLHNRVPAKLVSPILQNGKSNITPHTSTSDAACLRCYCEAHAFLYLFSLTYHRRKICS